MRSIYEHKSLDKISCKKSKKEHVPSLFWEFDTWTVSVTFEMFPYFRPLKTSLRWQNSACIAINHLGACCLSSSCDKLAHILSKKLSDNNISQIINYCCIAKRVTELQLHLATYNVRTLSDECHLVSLENEIEKIKWDIIGISEMRRPGENVVELASQHIMFNKWNDKKQGGVGFLIHKKLKGNIEEFHATSNRVASESLNDTRLESFRYMLQPQYPAKRS